MGTRVHLWQMHVDVWQNQYNIVKLKKIIKKKSEKPWTVAPQAPLSLGLSQQEYQSGLSFPLPGNLPDPGIEPESLALAGRFFTTEPPGKRPMYVEMSIEDH